MIMAKIQLGSVATDIRGSVGGVTYSRNKGGAYSRARVTPLNPNSPKQTQVRANFGNNAKSWSSLLSSAQQAAWTLFAQANPIPNVFGASIILSGLSTFMRLNQILSQIGSAQLLDPPANLSVPALAAATGATVDSEAPQVLVTTTAQAVVAGAKYYIFATGGLAPGAKPQQAQYRFMGAFAAVAAAVSVDITDAWFAAFGTCNPGASVGIAIATVNTETGAVTPAVIFNVFAS